MNKKLGWVVVEVVEVGALSSSKMMLQQCQQRLYPVIEHFQLAVLCMCAPLFLSANTHYATTMKPAT